MEHRKRKKKNKHTDRNQNMIDSDKIEFTNTDQ